MKNYISAEEFLSLDKEVQKAFIDWWKPKRFDLFNCIPHGMENRENLSILNYYTNTRGIEFYYLGFDGILKSECIPLLQTHQLIDFIEEKTNYKINITYCSEGYYLEKVITDEFYENIIDEFLGHDLMNALFKISIIIAKQITQD